MAEASGDDRISSRKKYDSQISHSQNLRQAVYELLDKNPLLTARPLCKLLNLPYRRYRDYVAHVRSKWRYDRKNGLGLSA